MTMYALFNYNLKLVGYHSYFTFLSGLSVIGPLGTMFLTWMSYYDNHNRLIQSSNPNSMMTFYTSIITSSVVLLVDITTTAFQLTTGMPTTNP